MNRAVLESQKAALPWRNRPDVENALPQEYKGIPVSARASTERSVVTAIRADMGESEAYKQALFVRREVGLQRPMKANVRGVDFISAAEDPSGKMWIIVTDVKTTTTGNQRYKEKPSIPGTWLGEARDAVARMKLVCRQGTATAAEIGHVEQEIQAALDANRIRLRYVEVDYSPAGQGRISFPF